MKTPGVGARTLAHLVCLGIACVSAVPARAQVGSFGERTRVEVGRFTVAELRVLGQHGWRGDRTDERLARLLLQQGFSSAEIVRAYVDARRAGVDRQRVPRAARFRALRLPTNKLAEALRSERSLTDWHNQEHVGHWRGLRGWGWFLSGLGITSAVAGIIVTTMGFWPRHCSRAGAADACEDHEDFGRAVGSIFGLPTLLVGVLELAAGIPMVVVARNRRRRWVPGRRLDLADRDELVRYASGASPARSAAPSLLVSPFFARGGGGLTLHLRF